MQILENRNFTTLICQYYFEFTRLKTKLKKKDFAKKKKIPSFQFTVTIESRATNYVDNLTFKSSKRH